MDVIFIQAAEGFTAVNMRLYRVTVFSCSYIIRSSSPKKMFELLKRWIKNCISCSCLSHTLKNPTHLNPKVRTNPHKSMQIYAQTFSTTYIQNRLWGRFPCYTMTSGLLMTGDNPLRPPFAGLALPPSPTPFPCRPPPTPPLRLPTTSLMSSNHSKVEQQFPFAAQSLMLSRCLPALAYTLVCLCV